MEYFIMKGKISQKVFNPQFDNLHTKVKKKILKKSKINKLRQNNTLEMKNIIYSEK